MTSNTSTEGKWQVVENKKKIKKIINLKLSKLSNGDYSEYNSKYTNAKIKARQERAFLIEEIALGGFSIGDMEEDDFMEARARIAYVANNLRRRGF